MIAFISYYVWIVTTHFSYEWDHASSLDVIVNVMFLWSLYHVSTSTTSDSSPDHRCDILNRNVGKRNHKAFILLCLYGTIGNGIASYRRRDDVIHFDGDFSMNVVVMFFATTCVTFGGAMFLIFHVILLYKGIRSSTICRKLFGKKKKGGAYIRPVDNYKFHEVFGANWWFWLLPI